MFLMSIKPGFPISLILEVGRVPYTYFETCKKALVMMKVYNFLLDAIQKQSWFMCWKL